MYIFVVTLIIFLASFSLTWLMRRYALKKSILDIPNERSSHTQPTPRGGGIAIAVTFFFSLIGLKLFGFMTTNLFLALLGGGLVIALTGYWDDLKSLPARIRASLHFVAAFWGLYWLGGFSILDLGFIQLHLGLFGSIIAAIGIVWLINLYNFMDGIDGIAGSEAVFISVIASIVLYLTGANGIAIISLFLFASVFGFLVLNWPPAKIFMGDVGSGLLGYIFAVLALASANQHKLSLWFWLILLSVFIFDATFTLIHRVKRGERLYIAHREHIYQRLVIKGASHKQVTLLITFINLGFVLPIAFLSLYWQKFSLVLFLLVGIVFFVIWHRVVFQLPMLKCQAKTADSF